MDLVQKLKSFLNQAPRANTPQFTFNLNAKPVIQNAYTNFVTAPYRAPFQAVNSLQKFIVQQPQFQSFQNTLTNAYQAKSTPITSAVPFLNNPVLNSISPKVSPQQILNAGMDFTLRPIAQTGAKAALDIANKTNMFNQSYSSYTPTSTLGKFTLGSEQLNPFQADINKLASYLENPTIAGKRLPVSLNQNNADMVAPLAIGAVATANVLPFGLGKVTKLSKSAKYLRDVADLDSINKIKQFAAWVDSTGGKIDPIQAGFDKDLLPSIQAIARDVFGDQATYVNNKQLKNAFDTVLTEIGRKQNRFNLGLETSSIKEGIDLKTVRETLDNLSKERGVLYHGSTSTDKVIRAGGGHLGEGVYLTSKPGEARNYAAGFAGGADINEFDAVTPEQIKKVQLLTKNLFKTDNGNLDEGMIAQIKAQGYDGVETPFETVIFDPKKVKFIGNPTKEEFAMTNPVNSIEEQLNNLPDLRTKGKNMYTNVREIDNKLVGGQAAMDDWRKTFNARGENLPWEQGQLPEVPRFTQQELKNMASEAKYNAETGYKDFRQMFNKWVGQVDAARTRATVTGAKYKDIPSKDGGTIIKNLEAGRIDAEHVGDLHKSFDSLFNEAKGLGLNLGYRQNYITHYWTQTREEVEQLYKVFKQRGAFQNTRTIPTYEEGLAMGLTPKYSNPAQILTAYAKNIETLKANINFFKELKAKGFIVPASIGKQSPGFVPLNAMGLPKNMSQVNEQIFIGDYYAPKEVAATLNKMFNPEQNGLLGKSVNVTGNVSSKFQDIGLSGGIPKTPANAFTFGQLIKEVTALRVSSPIVSFARSLSGRSSAKFFEENADQIIKMQERNVPVRSNLAIENLIDKDTTVRTLGEKTGKLWGDLVNDATFQRFMPQLQVNLFNDIERQALKGGRNATEAADIAAKAVKNFYGLTNTGDEALRSKTGQDIVRTVFFAPKFRESMINFWINNVKALRHPLVLENRTNMKFMAGAILTVGAYDFLNRAFTGHGLLGNPEGKQDKLLIPQKDGTVIGIPLFPSVATLPRALFRQILAVGQGDITGAAKDAFQSYASMAIKPAGDVIANSDYFGKTIVNEYDSPSEKLKKQGAYLASQYSGHPYVKELLDPRNQGDPLYQRFSRATELPFRFYDQKSIAKGNFYNEYYKNKSLAEAGEKLSFQDPKKAEAFLSQHKNEIEKYYYMKQVQNEYYDQIEKGNDDPSILSNSNNIQNVNRVGNSIIYKDRDGKWDRVELAKFIATPKMTGDQSIDKMAIEKYRDELSARMTEIYTIGKLHAVPGEKATAELYNLLNRYNQARAIINTTASGKKPITMSDFLTNKLESSFESQSNQVFKDYQDGKISFSEAKSKIGGLEALAAQMKATKQKKAKKVKVPKVRLSKGKKIKLAKVKSPKIKLGSNAIKKNSKIKKIKGIELDPKFLV